MYFILSPSFFLAVYHTVVHCVSWICILFYLLVCLLSPLFPSLPPAPSPCNLMFCWILKSVQTYQMRPRSVILWLCTPPPPLPLLPSSCPSMELKETRRGQAVPKVWCLLSLGCKVGEDQTVSEVLATRGLFADPAEAAGMCFEAGFRKGALKKKEEKEKTL